VLPLQYPAGQSASSLGLVGDEVFSVSGVTALDAGGIPATVSVTATGAAGTSVAFEAVLRIDTPGEADYYRHGGILQYVLRSLLV
jgi:aconitate hydratase